MNASMPGRPSRIVIVAVALAGVGALAFLPLAAAIAEITACGPSCGLAIDGLGGLLFVSTPIALPVLAVLLFVRPAAVRGPVAVLAPVFAVGFLSNVIAADSPAATDVAAVAALLGCPFVLFPPIGPDAIQKARVGWVLAILAAVALFLLDEMGSRFMRTGGIVPFQWAFLAVAGTVVVAGLAGRRLAREPGSTPERQHGSP